MIGQHVLSAFAACCLLGGALLGGSTYVRSLEGRYIDGLAPDMFDLTNRF